MRVLVVDDSRAVRLLIGNVLRESGFEVLEAADGQQALDRLTREEEIDLVLVDWNMPVMDGLEFIIQTRRLPQFRELKIVMVTTESESDQMIKAMRAGANEYIMKPFTKDILIAKLSLLDVFGS